MPFSLPCTHSSHKNRIAAVHTSPPEVVIPKDTLGHLDEILHSRSFITSPRCQDFLRFVVHELVEGRGDGIKERTIALEVFGKSARFDPGSDSLVRVKAREVRKRLAEYYETAPADTPLRFELPLGSYVPLITESAPGIDGIRSIEGNASAPSHRPGRTEAPVAKTLPETPLNRRRALWLLSGAAVCAAGASLPLWRLHPGNLDALWKPVFAKESPLLIFIPLLPKVDGEGGSFTDRVGMGTTAVVSEAAQYLTRAHHSYRLRFGADLTFSQLREQPSLLLGGFSSQWTIRMTRDLRFNLVDRAPNEKGAYVIDNKTGHRWGPVIVENGFTDVDYSILCRLFDTNSGEVIFIAAGITTFGTESAASFLFSEELFTSLLKDAPGDWKTKNFQVLIQTNIIGLTPSTPKVLDSYFW